MSTRKEDIREWLERGSRGGATHMLVVCDTFDWSDYPVYVTPDQDVREVETQYHGRNMQKVMEVYNLNMDLTKQLNEVRAFNY